MTATRKTTIQLWLPTIVAIFAVATNILVVGRWTARIEDKIAVLEKHASSETIHMPLKQKIDLFITRREAERADEDIKKTLNSLDQKIDFLYKRAQQITANDD